MKRTIRIAAAAVLSGLGAAVAHHSFAMFALDKVSTISGTVKEWQWTNPHCWLELEVKKPDGTTQQYSFESRSIYLMTRAHVSRHTLQPGMAVTVTYNPLRDGMPGGSLLTATAADGTALIAGRGPPPPPK